MQIGHSEPRWTIPVVLIANSMSLLLYNVAGMFVTEEMGAVSRTVFESARTLFVWLGDLLLYYTHTGLGEKWDNSSYLQVCLFYTLYHPSAVQAKPPSLWEVPGYRCSVSCILAEASLCTAPECCPPFYAIPSTSGVQTLGPGDDLPGA